MAGPQNGDSAIGQPLAAPTAPDASAKLSADAQPTTGKWAGDGVGGQVVRAGAVTVDGLAHTPEGMYHTAINDITHPQELLKMVGVSAALGAGLKLVLPEAGPVAKIAGLAMGAYFVAQSAPGFIDAYKDGANAKSWSEINDASKKWGDSAGGLIDNAGLGYVGFKIGSGAAGSLLSSESMDGFAANKATFWNGVESKLPTFAQKLGVTDQAAMLKPQTIDGRTEFQGSARAVPTDAQGEPLKAEPIDPDSPMSVTIKVARQNQGTFDRLVERIKAGKAQPITREEFNSRFGASPDAIAEVKKFADAHGLQVRDEDINPGARSVKLSGTVGDMSKAFNVKLENFSGPENASFRGRTGTYSVPENLGDKVTAVLGLDQRDVVKPKYVMAEPMPGKTLIDAEDTQGVVADGAPKPKAPGGPRQAPMPADVIMKSYGGDSMKYQSEGRNHAFNSFGGTIDDSVPTYLKSKGIDPSTLGTIDRATTPPTSDPSGANVENDLDAVDQKLNLRKGHVDMISNDNSTEGFVGGIDYVNHPPTGVEYDGSSTSWGGPDQQAWNTNGRAELDQSLKDGIALGKMHSFSSGDDGATDRGSLPVQTDYPASSGNGVAVGGTKEIINKDGTRGAETTWSTSGATGGGVSGVEARPVFQKAITWIKNASGKAFAGRIVPDISMNASPETPVEVPTAQGLAGVGGTSSSNPLFYALTRQLSEASGKQIGNINPLLYKWGADPVIAAKVFNDITVGDNGMGGKFKYSAGPGFDAATGWGSPNFQGMLDELNNPTHPLVTGARSAGYGAYTGALRTAFTVANNPKVLLDLPKGINLQNNNNQTGG